MDHGPVPIAVEGDDHKPWTKHAGCSVWGGSDEGPDWQCSANKNFAEAEAICQAASARLCTVTELEDGCTVGTGCNFNTKLVWGVPAPPPSPPLNVSMCPNVRHDLCGALGTNDSVQNGDRLVNTEGTTLCFTEQGDVQLGRNDTVLQSLGLSGSGAFLVMQVDGNLAYYDESSTARWAFSDALGAPTSGCTRTAPRASSSLP